MCKGSLQKMVKLKNWSKPPSFFKQEGNINLYREARPEEDNINFKARPWLMCSDFWKLSPYHK